MSSNTERQITVSRKDPSMMTFHRRALGTTIAGTILGLLLGVIGSMPAAALEAGERAPEFTLASSTGGDISLRDFRGKKWVLLEFYGADFVPT